MKVSCDSPPSTFGCETAPQLVPGEKNKFHFSSATLTNQHYRNTSSWFEKLTENVV